MCITVEWLKVIVWLSCFFLWLTCIGIWSCCWDFFLIVLGSGWVCKCGFRSWRFNGMITVTSSSRYKLHSQHWLISGRDTTTCLFSGGMLYAHCSYHFVEWSFFRLSLFPILRLFTRRVWTSLHQRPELDGTRVCRGRLFRVEYFYARIVYSDICL